MTDERRGDGRVGDAAVDAAWREASGEYPPASVDAAILAAARTAVRRDERGGSPERLRRWARWQPLAAAAGVVGLSFLVVQMLPREHLAGPPAIPDAPPPPTPPATVPANPDATQGPATESAAAPPSAPPPARAPAPAAAKARDAASVRSGERAAPAGAAPPAALEATARQSDTTRPEPPAAWAERIAALHDAGDLEAAAAELRAFRSAHADADHYLPEVTRAWAASVSGDAPR